MQDIKPIIAKNITILRQNAKMTQSELAEKLNYSDKAISKWERGESIPDITVLKALADLFGVHWIIWFRRTSRSLLSRSWKRCR